MYNKNFGSRLFPFVTMHAFDGQSDRQTDFDSKTVRRPLGLCIPIRTLTQKVGDRIDAVN